MTKPKPGSGESESSAKRAPSASSTLRRSARSTPASRAKARDRARCSRADELVAAGRRRMPGSQTSVTAHENRPVVALGGRPEVRAPELGDDPPARRALEEAELEQVRLVDVLDRVGLLAERDRERREADRARRRSLLDDRAQQLAVGPLEPALVDLEQLERLARDVGGDRAGVPHLARRRGRGGGCGSRSAACRASGARSRRRPSSSIATPRMRAERRTIRAELRRLVELEPEGHAEAVAQRRRQQAGARRRADERERRQVERQRARGGALADDDVEPEVLERRVEDLLDGAVEPVDLVDEEHVARLEAR